ncbi:growth arrest and DNA damage-inducible protein GADD45 alpha isoform X1 [Mycteria americana]|uniref:growth arrest and DNA damage-inducible protein GADD45 alpha isoform X1 n=1 Tax=Mycteria americana TaxID=33587 RepID=UPI003F58F9F3
MGGKYANMAGAGWPVAGRITPAGRLCAAEAAAARSERGGRGTGTGTSGGCTMTLEELPGDHRTAGRMEQAGDALEEVLSKALSQRSLTLGVYEAAKLLNVDPDNVVLCLLAADEEEAGDAALQIHFTLIQAFCCENDINILRVSNPARLAQLLLPAAGPEPPADLHCVLVTNPHASQWKDPALSQLMCFCRESRYMDQWVPVINLPER